MRSLFMQVMSQGSKIESMITVLFTLAIVVGLFLLFRGIVLWYYKIDKIVNNQQQQINQFQTIIEQQQVIIDNLNTKSHNNT